MWFEGLSSKNTNEISSILAAKSKAFVDKFAFPDHDRNAKEALSETLCAILENANHSAGHIFCLELVRLFSRDPAFISNFLSHRLVKQLVQFGRLETDYSETQNVDFTTNFNETVEAQKALSNAVFQCEQARRSFLRLGGLESLSSRLKLQSSPDISLDYHLRSYDIRLFFIITATCADTRVRARDELGCLNSLTSILYRTACTEQHIVAAQQSDTEYSELLILSSEEAKLAADVLKALFNLTMGLKSESICEGTLRSCDQLCMISRVILVFGKVDAVNSEEEEDSLISNVVNLLTSIPSQSYKHLVPEVKEGHDSSNKVWVYLSRDMRSIDKLLEFLGQRLDKATPVHRENLHPIIFLLCELAKSCRVMRKYMRLKILPPLRNEVMRRPEEGDSLRNKLVKLMTAVTDLKDVAADFLYILCKKNVDRLVKYTGFGNAAGLLASYGLMAGRRETQSEENDSPDEDSDTEEYLNIKDQVNPVLGCFEPERPDPMAGMSEEQKEYEAMKLVDQINKLMGAGVIKPATVDQSGRVKPIEHVLELRDKADSSHGVQNGQCKNDEESD